MPVVLFHAGLGSFKGGFVGVDIFFVISGYLITSIIIHDLEEAKFSFLGFYERRARRLLPALFVVMGLSIIGSYLWMLPDELENFGQSVVATTLFSNNVLLALTSGYWALASEFKPLLHTWSLGLEEQYYIAFPCLLVLIFRGHRRLLVPILLSLAVLSFASAYAVARYSPEVAFYILPTRGWELLIGVFAALLAHHGRVASISDRLAKALSSLGLVMIMISVMSFDESTIFPVLNPLLPCLGTLSIILFSRPTTLAYRLLSRRILVAMGLMSYSIYLWHQPLFSFARILSKDAPSESLMVLLSVFTIPLGFFTWRYVETPFRRRESFSRRAIFTLSSIVASILVLIGSIFHYTHGVPSRMYQSDEVVADDLYISYNKRVFGYKKDSFDRPELLNVLVIGNSFGRDFVNMTLENFKLSRVELVYRDDAFECIAEVRSPLDAELYKKSDLVVFASGAEKSPCITDNIQRSVADGKQIFYVGTKDFGYNLNWLMRLAPTDRPNQYNQLSTDIVELERNLKAKIPAEHYISILDAITRDGWVRITDDAGRLLSPDRTHVTKYGAQLIGKLALRPSRYGELLGNN